MEKLIEQKVSNYWAVWCPSCTICLYHEV